MSTYQSKYTGAEIDLRLEEAEKISPHMADTENPHGTTKSHVGLGNVDNTADKDKPLSDAATLALADKVDKVAGKGLSANDYTNQDRDKLAGIDVGAEVNPVIADDLTTDDPAKVLSANQGKILKDNADALADLVSTNVGDLETLTTTDKSSLVNATNEVKNLVDTNSTDIEKLKQSKVKIYGVKFSGSNPVGERTHDAIGMVANVGVDDQLVQNDFDNVDFYDRPRCNIYHGPDGEPIVMAYEGEPGFSLTGGIFPPYADLASVFYECKPCAWNGSFDEPQITGTPMEGFELFECFPDWNTKIYLPSYWMATVNGKPTSISGVHPTTYSLDTGMTAARNYHANGHLETMAAHMYEYVLQLVEFATRDVQTVMMGASSNAYDSANDIIATVESDTVFAAASTVGARFVVGQTISIGSAQNGSNRTSTAVIQSIVTDGSVSTFTLEAAVPTMVAGDFISTRAWRNGATDIVAASSGSPVSNTNGKHPCIWRGKVDPWAMAYSCICDLLIQRSGDGTSENPYAYTPCYLPDPTKYADGAITEDYIKLNLSLPGSDGYAKSLDADKRYRFIGLTNALGASSTTWLAAYYYYPRHDVCAVRVGGGWVSGRSCSPVYFGCYYRPSYSVVGYLARLSVRRN